MRACLGLWMAKIWRTRKTRRKVIKLKMEEITLIRMDFFTILRWFAIINSLVLTLWWSRCIWSNSWKIVSFEISVWISYSQQPPRWQRSARAIQLILSFMNLRLLTRPVKSRSYIKLTGFIINYPRSAVFLVGSPVRHRKWIARSKNGCFARGCCGFRRLSVS